MKIFAILNILLLSFQLFAQPVKSKWGAVPQSDLNMSVYPNDSSASSVILQDIGNISLRPVNGKYNGFLKQHRRIKVFQTDAFNEGNLMIPYYSYENTQRLRDLDIQVIQPNGERQKVKSDNVFTEKINKYWSAEKIFIPNLQKGCIIEYRYELVTSNIYSLFDWYFQQEQPVRLSEITIELPSQFEYVYLMSARDEVHKKTEESRKGAREIIASTVLALYDQPAIKQEPFVDNADDYRAHIRFQLKIYFDSGYIPNQIMTTWENLAKKLEEDKEFGGQYLRKSPRAKKVWEAFKSEINPDTDKPLVIAEKALHFISQNIQWNGKYRIYSSDELNDVFEAKTGSSADINLMLTALLQRAGLDASPVLISTRSNGEMYPHYPFTDQFNSVLVLLQNGDESIVLDGTQPFLKPGELQLQHNNGTGWVVDDKNPDWVSLAPSEFTDVWFGDMSLSENGDLDGKLSLMAGGAEAQSRRSALSTQAPAEYLKKEFFKDMEGVVIDSVEIINLNDLSQALKVIFKCHIPEAATMANDFIYFSPVLHSFFSDNPFKSTKRYFPVNIPFRVRNDYVFNIKLPEGYALEELPKSQTTLLPNDGGRSALAFSQPKPGMLQMTLRTKLNQINFAPEEYDSLRQFFDVAHQNANTQLVFKKQ